MNYGDVRLPQRYWDKVHPEPNTGCWLWCAYCVPKGYGYFWLNRHRKAHHVTLELTSERNGADCAMHSCDQPSCVNPAHLSWGSLAENNLDRDAKGHNRSGVRNAAKTHCPAGHAYTPDNLLAYRLPSRICRTCHGTRRRVGERR